MSTALPGARKTLAGGGVGKLRERAGDRLAIGEDAEELLEIDEERIFARAGEHLHAGRACRAPG